MNWLREWVETTDSTECLAERLTMAGLEVEGIESSSGDFTKVVAGQVKTVAPHPNADRLRVCQVDYGAEESVSIVCGAPNVRVGMVSALALPGAVIGSIKIKKSKLRGEVSAGMLCSEKELGVSDDAEGIVELDDDVVLGTAAGDLFDADDVALEIALTPNRGDCLSVAGMAREIAALSSHSLREPKIPASSIGSAMRRTVEIIEPRACPRYVGRVIEDIDCTRRTPWRIRQRLLSAGVRPVSPVVDVGNYVMMELGQPLHAFDNEKLSGAIRVRMAEPGESLMMLDGKSREFSSDTLLIADERGALAMAGVMGGMDSAVEKATRCIFLESAWFAPEIIMGQARRHALHSEAAHRFERGVERDLQERAIERATQLILEICGGRAGELVIVEDLGHFPQFQAIPLRLSRVEKLLGMPVQAEEAERILGSLGLQKTQCTGAEDWHFLPPAWRSDLVQEEDLIEELARIKGYDTIPRELPPLSVDAQFQTVDPCRSLRQTMVARGYSEVVTWSFIDPEWHQDSCAASDTEADDEWNTRLVLRNPISPALSLMRFSLWPGLLQCLVWNRNRQQDRIRLFELGRVYHLCEGRDVREPLHIAGVISGNINENQWDKNGIESNLYYLKGDVEALMHTLGVLRPGTSLRYDDHSCVCPMLHPSQKATMRLEGGVPLGYIGRIHPELAAKRGLPDCCYLFDIKMESISSVISEGGGLAAASGNWSYSDLPSINRDLSILVPNELQNFELFDFVWKNADSELVNIRLMDLYRDTELEKGKKSVLIRLTFQAKSSTLTDLEADSKVNLLLGRLAQEFGISRR
ncbi:MAG: phenylalanine--tRNA ligase subunit beta [Candidatus Eutrophobiaceae bacterium]